jgi:hypothetical protein
MKMKAQQETVNQQVLSEEFVNDASNVLDFTSTLKELRKNVDPNLVRHREAWRDRNGNVRMVEYVEWHTVADILDETAPNWGHTVKDIRAIGDFMIVTVAITIDGVTREGIGTGTARSETGIKNAEHDALKRAAVKFGIARDLYKREFDAIERREEPVAEHPAGDFPADPIAKTISDMVTTKQLGMIRAVSREIGIDADEECSAVMKCKISELSRRAASALIDHLREMQPQQVPMRKAS